MTLPLADLDDHQLLLAARLGADPDLVVDTRGPCRLESAVAVGAVVARDRTVNGIRINVHGIDAVAQAARGHGPGSTPSVPARAAGTG